jgi:membrane-associated phospholipid phosphatase
VYGTAAILLFRRAGPDPTTARSRAGQWRRAAAVGLVVLVVTIGVARVYNGQHDTTDVLAGWLLGALWARAVTLSPFSDSRATRA